MFNTLFYAPIYNVLVWFIDIIPSHDAGIALVLVTILVSILLFSVSKKAIKTQIGLKEIEPELKKIKETVKDQAEQARQIMALYRKHKVNPFSMILLILIQFPVLIALYYMFFYGLPVIHTELLYSFVANPPLVNMNFLGLVDLSQKSIVLAGLAGATQYVQAHIMSKRTKVVPTGQKKTMQEEFAHSMQMQMKYFLPIIIGLISLGLPSALPLYWSVRNLFSAGQELVIMKEKK